MAYNLWYYPKCLFIVLLAIAFFPNVHTRTCIVGIPTKGYTYPSGDIFIEHGKNPLEIYCVIDDKNYLQNVSDASPLLYFKRNKSIVTENVEVVNTTTIRLYTDDLEISKSTYSCMLESECVCSNIVYVGTKPHEVTDFHCISYNYDNLTCSWTYSDEILKPKFELKYTFPGRANRQNMNVCPMLIEDKDTYSCFWNVSTQPHYRQTLPIFYFTLTVENKFGSTSMNYTLDHYKYVKPGPPENLVALNSTTNSIFLHWNISNSMVPFSPGLQYRVLYQCEYGPKDWKLADLNYIQNKDGVFYNLTGLKYAHELCDIRVSLRSNKSTDENMWSTNGSVTYRTASAVPGAPPKVNIGSFQLDKQYNLTKRVVYIYWQQLPEEIKNGENFEYKIEPLGDASDLKLLAVTNAYAKYENLSNLKDYTFAIWSQNSEGRSRETSYVTVPEKSKRPGEMESFSKFAFENGTYDILFFENPKPNVYNVPIKNYTIFWCKNFKDRPYQCVGHLNWTEVPSDTLNYKVPVPETNDSNWQFAISVNSDTASSGMIWAPCTVLHSQTIPKIKQFYTLDAKSTYLELAWKLDCLDRIPGIVGFRIYYCPIVELKESNCKEPQKNITIYSSKSNYGNVSGLTPYTTYMLTIAILTKNGDVGEESDVVYGTTLEGAPSPPLNLQKLFVTNSSAKIAWYPPEKSNGALKYYEIHYNNDVVRVDPPPFYESKLSIEYTFLNLTSYKNYTFTVKACTTACSDPSLPIRVETKIGRPGIIKQPAIRFQNNSLILVKWSKPDAPRGKNDYYEVQVRRQKSDLPPLKFNVTEPSYAIKDCGEDGQHNTFYLSVRAVNMEKNIYFKGPWSEELECYCSNPMDIIIIVVIFIITVVVLILAFVFRRVFFFCKDMKNVELKLPPGLDAIPDWNGHPKKPEPEHFPLADEELLLVQCKVPSKTQSVSRASSGCSSGPASDVSESGTIVSSTSDSGTEQNGLRKRPRNENVRTTVNSGYVTMPTETITKPKIKQVPGNYCILGVNPGTQTEIDTGKTIIAPDLTNISKQDDKQLYVQVSIR